MPVAAAEMIAGVHLPGLVPLPPAPYGRGDQGADRRKQANRDKRSAKTKRIQSDREELPRLGRQARNEDGKFEGKKGGGKGKSKDQAGNQLCFSWGSGTGPCADVPPGGECKCKVKRTHVSVLFVTSSPQLGVPQSLRGKVGLAAPESCRMSLSLSTCGTPMAELAGEELSAMEPG